MKRLLSVLLAVSLALSLCTGLAFAAGSGEVSIDWMPDSLGNDPNAPEYNNVYVGPSGPSAEEYAAAKEELLRMLQEEGISSDEIDLDAYLAEMMPMTAAETAPEVTTPSTKKANDTGANAASAHYYSAAAEAIAVPDQGSRSICWAVAATDCLRIGAQQDGIDVPALDPEHLVYYSYHGFTDDLALTERDYIDPIDAAGRGNVYASLMTLASWGGPAETLDKTRDHNIYSDNALWLQNGSWLRFTGSEDRAAVKSAIVELGAVAASLVSKTYFSDSRYYNSATNAFCTIGSVGTLTDHEIVIVGWDDDYSAANFATAPTDADGNKLNGAWLCRNTWGDGWGDGGYFWLSYHDAGLTGCGVGVAFDAREVSDEFSIYQYDGNYTLFSTETVKAQTVTTANVFTGKDAAGEDILRCVGLYSAAANTRYTVDVYVGLSDKNDPRSGRLTASASGTFSNPGYQTAYFDHWPYIPAGESFSVVYTLTFPTASGNTIPVCSAASASGLTAYNSASAGESFLLSGDKWIDRSAKGVNYRIKAFTCSGLADPDHTHSWQDDATLTKPGCTEDGSKRQTCTCGACKIEAIPAAHTLDFVAAKAATAVKPGNTEYWKCSVCGQFFSDADGKTKINETATVIAAKGFDDVKATAYYHDEVLWAVENGVTTGATETSFDPDGKCTRAQLVTFLWRRAGSPAPAGTTCPFTDLDRNEYYYPAVLWATENDIVKGMTPTTFSPYLVCIRAQAVTLLYRSCE